jgi:aminopeptidase N
VDRAAGVLRRTPPPGHPADRTHTIQVATGRGGRWTTTPATVDAAEVPFDAGEAAVVVDPGLETWALVLPDEASVAGYVDLFPVTTDHGLRSSMWSAVRSAFHNAAIAPARVLDVAEAAVPSETNDDAVGYTLPWLVRKVAPLAHDPVAALARIHDACAVLLQRSPAGSTVQLAAFQAAVASATDGDLLEGWLAGHHLPPGIVLDLDLRWRVLVQLAALGRQDPAGLQEQLDAEPTARSRVEHTRAMASLPTAEAKAWAWQRFTGEVAVPNYEVEAAGLGMWRPGQEALTAPYVDRYFAELPAAPAVHSGWMLGDVTEAFFPATALEEATVARADALVDADGLDLTIRRNLVDATDELRRRIAVRARYGA